jgi:hypothetical protein
MYCPNCGQQQISDEMRFCSRCGLALGGLKEWLAGGGLPAKRTEGVAVEPVSPRRKGIRRAAKLMFFSGVLFVIFLVISLAIEEGAPLIFPGAVFFVALVMMLYARLFSDNAAPAGSPLVHTPAIHTPVVQSPLGADPTRGALPPAVPTAMPTLAKQRVRTNELTQPPSVTDHTTKLLDE